MAEAKETKPTKYVVMASTSESGPWMVAGTFTAHGQPAAKKLAAEKLAADGLEELFEDTTPDALFYIAFPASAFAPKRPKVKPATLSF